jgi:N2227-like protein
MQPRCRITAGKHWAGPVFTATGEGIHTHGFIFLFSCSVLMLGVVTLQVYGGRDNIGQFDAVLTCFFLDTAHNVLVSAQRYCDCDTCTLPKVLGSPRSFGIDLW